MIVIQFLCWERERERERGEEKERRRRARFSKRCLRERERWVWKRERAMRERGAWRLLEISRKEASWKSLKEMKEYLRASSENWVWWRNEGQRYLHFAAYLNVDATKILLIEDNAEVNAGMNTNAQHFTTQLGKDMLPLWKCWFRTVLLWTLSVKRMRQHFTVLGEDMLTL